MYLVDFVSFTAAASIFFKTRVASGSTLLTPQKVRLLICKKLDNLTFRFCQVIDFRDLKSRLFAQKSDFRSVYGKFFGKVEQKSPTFFPCMVGLKLNGPWCYVECCYQPRELTDAVLLYTCQRPQQQCKFYSVVVDVPVNRASGILLEC